MILEDTETHIRLAVKVDCSFQMWLNGVFCEHVVNDSKGWQLNELVKLQLYLCFMDILSAGWPGQCPTG